MNGDGLSKTDFIDLLNDSYNESGNDLREWLVDNELSNKKAKVYRNRDTGEIVISNRGTYDLEDVKTDMLYAVGVKDKRFDDYNKLVEQVKDKYDNPYIMSIGHSLGGLVANSNQNVDEIITYNKPQFIHELLKEPITDQLDIRSDNDIISFLNKYDRQKNDINIPSDSNILDAHKIDELNNLELDYIGKGIETSNIDKVRDNLETYYPELNDIYISDKKDKKFYILHPYTNRRIYFGSSEYQDYTAHQDEERRQNYLKRATKIKGNWKSNRYSPNWLSINLLWS